MSLMETRLRRLLERGQPDQAALGAPGRADLSHAELRTLVDRAGKHVALLVQRDDTKIFVPVDLG